MPGLTGRAYLKHSWLGESLWSAVHFSGCANRLAAGLDAQTLYNSRWLQGKASLRCRRSAFFIPAASSRFTMVFIMFFTYNLPCLKWVGILTSCWLNISDTLDG